MNVISGRSAAAMAALLADGTPSVLAMHPLADIDCLASAYALSASFRISSIWAPFRLDKVALATAERYAIRPSSELPAETRRVIFVDTNEARAVEYPGLEGREIFIIDHHQTGDTTVADASFIDVESPSCSELVVEILEAGGIEPSREVAELLIMGILFDTGRFSRGKASTLKKCASLLEIAGTTLEASKLKPEIPMDSSEQTAILKGMQRMVFRSAGGCIVCCSHTSAYESSVASALLRTGCDVAFVASESDGAVRVTGRSGPAGIGASINLVTLFERIAAGFGGKSGGHTGAAVLNTDGEMEAVLNSCAAECLEFLGSHSAHAAGTTPVHTGKPK